MHRGFFARAISDNPKDPLGSPYGTSVIAAYRSAGSLVALVRDLDSQLPEPTERLWFLWTHLFSCAVGYSFPIWRTCTDSQSLLGRIGLYCNTLPFNESCTVCTRPA